MSDISDKDKAEIRRMRDKLDSISGPGVLHTKTKIFIGSPPATPRSKRTPPDSPLVPVLVIANQTPFNFPKTGGGTSPLTLGGGKYLARKLDSADWSAIKADATDLRIDDAIDADEYFVNADAFVINLIEDLSSFHGLQGIFALAWDTGVTVKIFEGIVELEKSLPVLIVDTTTVFCF